MVGVGESVGGLGGWNDEIVDPVGAIRPER